MAARFCHLPAFWLLLSLCTLASSRTALAASVTREEAVELRDEVKGMFYHAFNNYMEKAYPLDELRPKSCTGLDTLGSYSLTLVDSLDMLALLGDRKTFSEVVIDLGKNLRFDKNLTVSVFETTIRVLGGLLSGHLLASDPSTGMYVPTYDDELLHAAEDLGRRLLPAFHTSTGIPYGSVNLLYGIDNNESQVTSTAGGGTLTLEFGILSRLTGDPVFEQVAKKSVRGLWAQRSQLDLVGAHINVFTGEWTQKDAGIGTSVDSFYEYLLKAYLMFGDEEYLHLFKEAYKAVMRHMHHDPWYVEVNMNSAMIVWPLFNSLQAFWPGLQVLAGDVDPAIRTHKAFFSVWKRYGFTPEGFNLAISRVQPGQRSYPLRPEMMESTYFLYKATRDPWYLNVGRDMVASLQYGARCECGYCHLKDVETHEQDDHMESFFLAETLKYLWLLFDLGVGGDNLVEKGPYSYIFNTEGHLFPLTPEIAMPSERCTYVGSSCSDSNNDKRIIMGDLYNNDESGHLETGVGFSSLKALLNSTTSGTSSDDEVKEMNVPHVDYATFQGVCPGLTLWQRMGIAFKANDAPNLQPTAGNIASSQEGSRAFSKLNSVKFQLIQP